MDNEFNIQTAERILMIAQAALAPARGHERIEQFPIITDWLGRSIKEIARLRQGRVALVTEALSELNGLMLSQLADATNRHGTLVDAVKEFRETNFHLRQEKNGLWRWQGKPDSDIHNAIEKLVAATFVAERNIQ